MSNLTIEQRFYGTAFNIGTMLSPTNRTSGHIVGLWSVAKISQKSADLIAHTNEPKKITAKKSINNHTIVTELEVLVSIWYP